jgi:signal transduction histidine kinase
MSTQLHLAKACVECDAKTFAALRSASPRILSGRIVLLLLACCCLVAQGEPPLPSTAVRPVYVAGNSAAGVPIGETSGSSLSHSSDTSVAATDPHIHLESGAPDVIFLFDKNDPSNVDQREFRYRLIGYDADWRSTRFSAAHYRQLTPGRYRLEVQERKSGEEWLSHVITLSIGEQVQIYRTWYFYLALVLLAIALPAYFYRRRVNLMKGRIGIVLEERNRIARECHDTLMAGFAAISWQLEATAKLFNDGDLASTPAAKSCELARSMVSHCQAEARRIIWDLRDSDEVTNILSQALSRTLAANHMREMIETTLDVEGDELPLAPGCVHHLVCIGQEAISNAIRHADPTQINVHLKYESDALSLSIRDNGRGFHSSDRSASRHGHFGIPVMEERARKLGGTFRLQTLIGSGTEVMVKVSFNALQQPVNQEHHVIRWIGI